MQPQKAWLRFMLFGLLYFTQGTILGYFASLNALYLLADGLNMADVGIFSTIALIPFMIKILFGMLSDRFNLFGLGYRKPYIVFGLIVQFTCLLVVASIHPGSQYWLFISLAFLLQLGMAFYDTCTDGLALDITPPKEKGILQGFMVGGRSIGVIVAASAAGMIAEYSWAWVFYFLAVLTLLPLPMLLFIKETEQRPGGEGFNWNAFRAFKNRQVLAAGAVGLIIFLVIVGANQLVNPALSERMDISLSTAGFITTVWGIGCTVGALTGGLTMDRLGDKYAVMISSTGVVLTLFLMPLITTLPIAFGWAVVFGLMYGASQAVYFALAMKYTKPAIAASMFSILMAVTNVGQGIGLGMGGAIAKNLGYPSAFIIFGSCMLLIFPFIPILFKKPIK